MSRREEIEQEIANINQVAKQNGWKYEKFLRGEFPEAKWAKFIESQNEMYEELDRLQKELDELPEE